MLQIARMSLRAACPPSTSDPALLRPLAALFLVAVIPGQLRRLTSSATSCFTATRMVDPPKLVHQLYGMCYW